MGFKDKYKHKSEKVQKDGSGAMLVPSGSRSGSFNQQAPAKRYPQQATPSVSPHQQQAHAPQQQQQHMHQQQQQQQQQMHQQQQHQHQQQQHGNYDQMMQQHQMLLQQQHQSQSQSPQQMYQAPPAMQQQQQQAPAGNTDALASYQQQMAQFQQQQHQAMLQLNPDVQYPSGNDRSNFHGKGYDGQYGGNLMDNATNEHGRWVRKPGMPDFRHLPPIDETPKRKSNKLGAIDHAIIGNYKPRTMSDYKASQAKYEKQRFGGLGPSDTDEKREARAKWAKMFEYGRCANQVNMAMMELSAEPQQRPVEWKPNEETKLAAMKRQRAMAYDNEHGFSPTKARPHGAKIVHDKPVNHRSASPDERQSSYRRKLSPIKNRNQKAATPFGTGDIDSEIHELEAKQRADQQRILDIKRQLGLVSDDSY